MGAEREQVGGANVFRLSAVSGLVTGVSANGVVFALRNPSSEKALRLLYLAIKARTVAGFTGAQELAVAAHLVTSFDAANYSGGTDLTNPASAPGYVNVNLPIRSDYSYTTPRTKSVLTTGCGRIADTGALTHGGSPVIQAQPFAWNAFSELATGAAVPKGGCDLIYACDRDGDQQLDFGSDAGFIVKVPIALGAGGTVRFHVDALFAER